MIGVVVIPGPSAAMQGLSEHRPAALLPLGDRPLLQHLIEYLVLQGVLRFELILEQAPEQIEAYLGDGIRWGCRIRYHLATEPERPYRSLQVIPELRDQPWLLVHANRFPYVRFQPHMRDSWAFFFLSNREHADEGARLGWTGMAVFPAHFPIGDISRLSRQELASYLTSLESSGHAHSAAAQKCVDSDTPEGFLNAQRLLLDGAFPDFLINGVEEKPGIRVSRNVVMHPSVQLVAPVYLGANCRVERGSRIGPHAVLSRNCVIDSHTVVRDSMVASGSYVGQHLELNGVIVDRSLLVNARLGADIVIRDRFLLSGLRSSNDRGILRRYAEAMIAVLLIGMFSPLFVALLVWTTFGRNARLKNREMVRLPASSDPGSWETFHLPYIEIEANESEGGICKETSGWPAFIRGFLPGLFAVAIGNLGFVGFPPRTREEILSLSVDWRSLYLNGEAGLITEASAISFQTLDETEAYLAEACYSATAGLGHQLKLVQRYFSKLLLQRRSGRGNGQAAEPATGSASDC